MPAYVEAPISDHHQETGPALPESTNSKNNNDKAGQSYRGPARFRPGPCSYPLDESYSPLRGSQSLVRDVSGCPNVSGADKEVTHCNQYARVSIPEHERSNWLLSTTRFTSNNTERRSSGRSV